MNERALSHTGAVGINACPCCQPVGAAGMGGQQAGFIMVMNPGGFSNYGCRWTEREGRRGGGG